MTKNLTYSTHKDTDTARAETLHRKAHRAAKYTTTRKNQVGE